MQELLRDCKNCSQNFLLDPEDLEFFGKINMPLPTWCPECKLKRLMLWRNERSLYRAQDSKYGKEIISIFAPEKKFMVYDQQTWWSDDWDPLEYGADYDFSKPFFLQFRELLERVPLVPLFNKNAVRSDYCNHVEDMKDSYLSFASIWSENASYVSQAIHCKDSFDVLVGDKSELLYECVNCEGCYRVFFSKNATACNNSLFLRDCSGCSHCFGCVNLRNKSYHIFNEPYSKEEYEKKVKEYDLGNFVVLESMKKQFTDFDKKHPRKFANVINSPGSTGDVLYDVKNCRACFHLTNNVENCKYMVNGGYNMKDSQFGYGVGVGELMYEVIDTGIGVSRAFAAVVGRSGADTSYTFNCHGSSNLFGCIGVRNKNYCILNRQYTREAYEELKERIIGHMNEVPYKDKRGITYSYGEFFHGEISPFAYNETIAQEYYPLTKDEALKQGYEWRDEETRTYGITLNSEDIPEKIQDISDDILREIIGCAHRGLCNEKCATAFKIITPEFEFYRKFNLSLPRLCPNCRYYQRLAERNPLRLWRRKCLCAGQKSLVGVYENQVSHTHGRDLCPNEFETSYAPERSEIVYCEQCYQAEVI